MWSAVQSVSSVLMSIQSLLHDAPYHNEPSFEKDDGSGDPQRYNHKILHETLRVGVCEVCGRDAAEMQPRRCTRGAPNVVRMLALGLHSGTSAAPRLRIGSASPRVRIGCVSAVPRQATEETRARPETVAR